MLNSKKDGMMGKSILLPVFGFLLVAGPAGAATDTVSIVDGNFVPSTLTVTEGDTVYWVQNGTMAHTTTSGSNCSSDGTWDSGTMDPGDDFMFIFTAAGNYPYFCTPHCAAGMTGQIVVQSSAVGLEEGAVASLMIYPNPATDRVHLAMNAVDGHVPHAEIYSLTGQRTVPSQNFNGAGLVVRVADLPKGVYILKVRNGNETIVRRFGRN